MATAAEIVVHCQQGDETVSVKEFQYLGVNNAKSAEPKVISVLLTCTFTFTFKCIGIMVLILAVYL